MSPRPSLALASLPPQFSPTALRLPASLSAERWRDIGRLLGRIGSGHQWWVGDWLAFGQQSRYVPSENYDRACELTGVERATLQNLVRVARAVACSRRREDLTWAHHVEVAGLDAAKQRQWLALAATGNGNGRRWSVRELRVAVQGARPNGGLRLPPGQFAVILADPPWKYGAPTITGAASQHYADMETAAICGVPVARHAAPDAVLFLWATNPMLPDALEVVEAWGFAYKTNVAWVKDKATAGLGFYVRGRHELLLIATRGEMLPRPDDRPESVLFADRREHSRKPDEAYALVEAMYPAAGPRLELFARHRREGWEQRGAELADA
jgi:N6-adenosine-specific RNA methylase IME4